MGRGIRFKSGVASPPQHGSGRAPAAPHAPQHAQGLRNRPGWGALPYPDLVSIAPPEAPPLPGLLYAQAQEYQARLAALEDGAAGDLARYWARAQAATQRDLDSLLARVAQATANGERLSPSWAFREARYRELLDTATEQGNLFGRAAAQLTEATQAQAAAMGATSASSLGSAAVASAGVSASFTAVNPDNVRVLAGFLADGTPLADLLGGLGTDALPRLRQVLGDGIVLGRGVDRIRRDVLEAVDVPRWWAETIVRTESHRVFREASREAYTRNADVLTGWTWLAALDSRTCPGCVAMHGTTHPVTATLDGHPRCRCAMVPLPEGTDLAPRPGVEWLADQPAATQLAVLGPGKFAAYQRGDLDLRALATRTEDPRWGTMRREATLTEALERTKALRRPQPTPRPGAGRTLTADQYETLRPGRAWSAEKRATILSTMRQTPQGKVLADTLERFQDGGSIARLRSKMDKHLAGEAIDATSQARAEALLGAIRDAPTDWTPRTLYRGMSVPGNLDTVLARYTPGQDLDLSLTSFSSDRGVAKRFQQMTAKGRSTRVMVEWVGDGKHALPIQDLPADRRLHREKEWVTAGRYRVREVKRAPDGSVLLRIEQTGTL